MSYKELTVDDMDKILSEFSELDYPKYHGNGLYEISKGVFCNEIAMKEFDKALLEELKLIKNESAISIDSNNNKNEKE